MRPAIKKREARMIRQHWLLLSSLILLGAVPGAASAQQTAALTASQRQGMQLFGQHCGVCHTKPTILSPLYGPALYKDTVTGKEAAVSEFIQKGTPRMPGFQYEFSPTQIAAIVDYLKTVPAPPAEAAAPAPRPNATNQREAD
jgi:mono/diheme cytochrome c family protein